MASKNEAKCTLLHGIGCTQISIGTFTKSLGFADLWHNHLALAGFALLFLIAAQWVLPKQER